ncbi:ribulokinase, partial [Serratia marcescens]
MMGEPLGHGLTQRAASEMGLIAGTAVSVSIIDAHAGTLGTLGATGVSGEVADFNRRVALIGGTSTGHMAMSRTARFIGGVWGPYYSAILPEYWLNEGGQSATGALIDHVIQSHPCYPELLAQAKTQGQTIYEVLNAILRRMAGEPENIAFLTQDIHMLPYFHGNRSPRANPTLTGILTGLKLSRTPEDMALHYLATIQAIALGTRHIIETMNHSGYSIDTIMASGGGTKNPIFVQEHANATGCAMLLPEESEAMLLGGAMMGTVAAGVFDTLPEAMSAMSRIGKTVTPQTNQIKSYYDRKYRVFHELYNDHMKYRRLMQEEA